MTLYGLKDNICHIKILKTLDIAINLYYK